MNLTNRAKSVLEAYLDHVRRSVSGQPGVDPLDVVAGVREHVATELSLRSRDPGTAEDLGDILERLGPPEAWTTGAFGGDVGSEPDGSPAAEGSAAGIGRGVEMAPLILAGAGGFLVLVELRPALGWACLAVGAVTARLVLGRRGAHRPRSVSGSLVAIFWWLSAVAATAAILLLPAVLVWSQAQVGGFLEPVLLDRTLPPGASPAQGTRPGGYWPLTAILASALTGLWWIGVGLATRAAAQTVRAGLGPAAFLLPRGAIRGTLLAGGFLLSLSVLVGALAWAL